MKYEIDKVAQQHEATGFPVRPQGTRSLDCIPTDELKSKRRAVRSQTEHLIEHGLGTGTASNISQHLVMVMTVTASLGVQLGVQPSVQDLLYAARELVEDARIPVDNGLLHKELEQVTVGMAMLEIVCRGVASVLNLPYYGVFEVFHSAYLNRAAPDQAAINSLLRDAGHEVQS